ncbi:putative terpene synthase 11 [Tasmannia lanceolata]|uniref:putative terpene synthase 11 n=1 Tax=Tasmannia lanceolata TaxID=3420 RepID=UPI004064B732
MYTPPKTKKRKPITSFSISFFVEETMAGLRGGYLSSSSQLQLFSAGGRKDFSTSCRKLSIRAQGGSYSFPPVYSPLFQDYNLLKPLSHQHTILASETDHCIKRVEELKEEAKRRLTERNDPTDIMKLIDTLQRLGIAYHFEEEIDAIFYQFSTKKDDKDLFLTSLRFRLLREHGYNIPPDVFNKFMNKRGKFKGALRRDACGMLSLYEASYMAATGEDILSEAMEFSKNHLESLVLSSNGILVRDIGRALLVPRHMRVVRLEARSYIEECGKNNSRNSVLLELATLDFNMVQCLHQREMVEILRWWKELGLVEKLSFARDRPLECHLWTVGIFWEPCFSQCRIELCKAIALLLVVDDIFDIYGSLDELILFTKAIQRWDLGAMEQLPEYMKICYMALYNTINEMGYKVLKEHGWNIISHLRKTWADLFESFLIEAKWFREGYVPSLESYLKNGVTTGGTYMALVHAFFLMGGKITKEAIGFIEPYPKLFSCSGGILRLWDDLGTSKEEVERGDLASSIECCKRENGISSEEDARNHIRQLICSLWKELNGELLSPCPLPPALMRASLNLARTAQVVYQHGDDDRVAGVDDHVSSLLVKPILHNREMIPHPNLASSIVI